MDPDPDPRSALKTMDPDPDPGFALKTMVPDPDPGHGHSYKIYCFFINKRRI